MNIKSFVQSLPMILFFCTGASLSTVSYGANETDDPSASAAKSDKHHQKHSHMETDSATNPTDSDTTADANSGREVMRIGRQILDDAASIDQNATAYLLNANTLRKRVLSLRSSERTVEDGQVKAQTKETADELALQIEQWQQASAELRDASLSLTQSAHALLTEGFSDQWQRWINSHDELSISAGSDDSKSHNNMVRSAHPTMQGLAPSTSEMPTKHENMSIPVPQLTGQPTPTELNTSSFQIARDKNYFAHVEVEPASGARSTEVPLNEIHQWRLLLSDIEGEPVTNAKIEIVGHMPGHVHGLPTQPRVTEEIAPGVYRIDGMKFQMKGWWIIEVIVDHDGNNDAVKFDIIL